MSSRTSLKSILHLSFVTKTMGQFRNFALREVLSLSNFSSYICNTNTVQ